MSDGTTEALPTSWPADGTTGYDALREVCGLFVDPRGESLIEQVATEHTGARERLSLAEHVAKRLVTDEILVAEVRRIAALVPPGDEAPEVVQDAVAELLAAYPVYRSYLPEGRADLDLAVDTAATARPDLADIVRRIRAGMLADPDGPLTLRVEQTSGMVTAKGVEDTTFYRWNRFVALNEVGGAPDRFGVTPTEFHAANAHRDAATPAAMTTLSTHDTKRSEDVRARLAVLSELTAEWGAFLRKLSARHPLPKPGLTSPSLELLAWQSLIGAWPITADRLRDYLTKAAKEAKLVTAHVDAVPEADEAIAAWPDAVLASEETVHDVEAFVRLVDRFGRSNALGQKLLQLAGPGVPDVYQGTELVEYSLVDPDNRRPVDFARRRELLARLDGGWMPGPVEASDDPDSDDVRGAKLLVTAAALRLRRFRPELFFGYAPVAAAGPAADHAVAFARGGPAGREKLVAVATRLPAGLEADGGWRDTVLPLPGGAEDWTDMVTGMPVSGVDPDGSRSCSTATRWRCWSARPERPADPQRRSDSRRQRGPPRAPRGPARRRPGGPRSPRPPRRPPVATARSAPLRRRRGRPPAAPPSPPGSPPRTRARARRAGCRRGAGPVGGTPARRRSRPSRAAGRRASTTSCRGTRR